MHHSLGIAHRGPVIWRTPFWLFQELHREFAFALDAAADEESKLCMHYFTPEKDALQEDWAWAKSVYLNPPYDRTLGTWVRKAFEESQRGCTVVVLVPVRTDVDWWHDYATRAEIRWIRGRLCFPGPNAKRRRTAPFPSAILVFRRAGYREPRPEV